MRSLFNCLIFLFVLAIFPMCLLASSKEASNNKWYLQLSISNEIDRVLAVEKADALLARETKQSKDIVQILSRKIARKMSVFQFEKIKRSYGKSILIKMEQSLALVFELSQHNYSRELMFRSNSSIMPAKLDKAYFDGKYTSLLATNKHNETNLSTDSHKFRILYYI